MVIFFFVSIIALIVIVLYTINPITRAVNNSIAKHNLAAEKRRQKEKESKRIENELESLRKESTELNSRKMLKEITPEVVTPFLDGYKVYTSEDEGEYKFYDWGLDEPMDLHRKGG